MFSLRILALAIASFFLVQLASASPVGKRQVYKKPGIVYSPYKGVPGATACKTPEEVASDIEQLKDFSMIRLYGLDCDQVKNVLPHAKKHNIKLFVGIYEVDRLDDEVNTLAGIMNGDWTIVDTVSVGNEFVLTGKKSVGDMVALTNQARDLLRGKGYQGPVVTVEVFYKYLEDPALCDGSDYIAANAHPYFDGNVAPENCGEFLVEMSRQIKEKCGGQKEVMIVETGWPTQGGINKSAVPGKDNQKKAIESIEKAFGEKVILFTAFNDLWKADNPSTNGVERFWGIL